MKVVCDNCRAVYKVPDDKLTKAVNKATCRNCGHRMLIPRPKPNADPEERTLVTAVAPTPVGAPPRDGRDGRDGASIDDLRVGTPIAQSRSEAPSPIQSSAEDFEGPDTKLTASPSEQITARESQRNVGRSLPPSPAPPARLPPKRTTPPPAPMNTGTGGTGSRRTPAPRTPAPLPGRGTGPRPAMYDPAGDLNWALLGVVGALLGGFLLALLSVWNRGPVGALVMWFGLALTFGGGVLTFMILLTGGRGRRPAQTLLSVILGFMVAVVMSSTMVATKWGAERVIDVYDIRFSNEGLTAGTSVPTAGGTTAPIAPPTTAPPTGAPPPMAPATGAPTAAGVPGAVGAVGAVTAPPAAPPPRQVAEASPPPPSRSAPPPPPPRTARTAPPQPPPPAPARTAPVPAPPPPEPDPVFEPEPEPPRPAPSAKEGLATVPMEVIHVMLSNNIEIKKCFVPLFKAGTLPPRIDLKFNILPSGTATGPQVLQSTFKGSELEGCLSRAVTSITFPPTTGTGTSITYPFVLQ